MIAFWRESMAHTQPYQLSWQYTFMGWVVISKHVFILSWLFQDVCKLDKLASLALRSTCVSGLHEKFFGDWNSTFDLDRLKGVCSCNASWRQPGRNGKLQPRPGLDWNICLLPQMQCAVSVMQFSYKLCTVDQALQSVIQFSETCSGILDWHSRIN